MVQCGSAGHNIRSKPGLRGTPAGRLKKGDKINSPEEVSTVSHTHPPPPSIIMVSYIWFPDIASVSHKQQINRLVL